MRAKLAIALCLIGLLLPGMALAQPIAVVMTMKKAAYQKVGDVIKSELGDEVRFYNMKDSRKHDDDIVAKVSVQNPSLVIALGDKAAYLSAEKLTAYPILIGMVLDLDKPEFKVPGIEGVGLQIPPKSVLTQLRMVAPQFQSIGVVSSSMKFGSLREEIRAAASEYQIQMVEMLAGSKDEVEKIVDEQLPSVDALWLLPDPNILDAKVYKSLVKKTQKAKKPLVVFSENFVRAGALFSVSPDYEATGKQIVILAKKMLAKEDVTPAQPYLAKFHYPIGTYSVLNRKTAETIGLTLTKLQLAFINRLVNGK